MQPDMSHAAMHRTSGALSYIAADDLHVQLGKRTSSVSVVIQAELETCRATTMLQTPDLNAYLDIQHV